jgi:hypothetical protein
MIHIDDWTEDDRTREYLDTHGSRDPLIRRCPDCDADLAEDDIDICAGCRAVCEDTD